MTPHSGGKRDVRSVDRWIADLAERQHGVVARRQLVDAGIGPGAIDRRLGLRRLHVLHRGVYAVGHRVLTPDGRWIAAVLASGRGAVLSHRAAAALWGVLASARLEVSVRHRRRGLPHIDVHQSRLADDELTVFRGIPVTSVSRTLLDLAGVLPPTDVKRAVNEAEFLGLRDTLSLEDLIGRYPGRRGIAAIKAIMAQLDEGLEVTRSELESRFLAFAEAAALPRPEVNARLFAGGRWMECDCVWRPERLVVELDGRAAHGTRAAFEQDRARDRALQAEGWRVVRITWRQLNGERDSIETDLRRIVHPPPHRG